MSIANHHFDENLTHMLTFRNIISYHFIIGNSSIEFEDFQLFIFILYHTKKKLQTHVKFYNTYRLLQHVRMHVHKLTEGIPCLISL